MPKVVTMSEVIYEDQTQHIVIERSNTCSPSLIELLEHTVWGTKGLLYVKHGVAKTLKGIGSPHFLTLTVEDKLVAGAVRIQKTIGAGQNRYNAFYLANLAVEASMKGRGYGKLLTEQSKYYFLDELGERGMLYGYIERGNIRSLQLNKKVGFQPVGRFQTVGFSHLRPQDNASVARLVEGQKEEIIQRLNEQYADHAFLDFEQSVSVNNYYVLKQQGEILAGVQAKQLHLTIESLPGLTGSLLVKVLPAVPILRRLFRAGSYRFLRFGNLYIKKGEEAAIFTLIESLLARYQLKTGMALMDKRSPVYQRMAATRKFGLFNAAMQTTMQMIADFKGIPEEEIAELRQRPLHISPLDIM